MRKAAVYLFFLIMVAGFEAYASEAGFKLKDDHGSIATLKDIEYYLPEELGRITFYGKNRSRMYVWDYFSSGADNEYDHYANQLRLGSWLHHEYFKFHIAYQYLQHGNLPTATSAGAGTGSLYYANSLDRESHGAYIKYLHVDIEDILDIGLTGSVGRFNYSSGNMYKTGSGAGYVKADASSAVSQKIDWVKGKRVADRLIGGFDWSEYQRSFDGFRLQWDCDKLHLSTAAFHPTQGGFEERAHRTIDGIDIIATELTAKKDVLAGGTEGQLFHYYYQDSRVVGAIARQDNSGKSIASGDEHDVDFHMIGGHLVGAYELGEGILDLLVWGGYQYGSWFELDHRAFAVALEAGYQFNQIPWKPHLRTGVNYGSGDPDAGDADHETFFQMLPTARLYSSSILYNMQNTRDIFGMLILKPHEKVLIRGDLHYVRLSESADRWYVGAGPISLNTAGGYAARSSGGEDELGTLVDIGIWWKALPDVSISGYYGHFFGGDVVEKFYTSDNDNDFFYADVTIDF